MFRAPASEDGAGYVTDNRAVIPATVAVRARDEMVDCLSRAEVFDVWKGLGNRRLFRPSLERGKNDLLMPL